jgi:hypothetical protein
MATVMARFRLCLYLIGRGIEIDFMRRIGLVGAAGLEPGDDDVVRVQRRACLVRG